MTAVLGNIGRDIHLAAGDAVDVDVIGGAVAGVRAGAFIAHASLLKGVGEKLIQREANGKRGVEIVVDELERKPVLRAESEFGQNVGGSGVEFKVGNVALLAAGVAQEDGVVVVVGGVADGDVVATSSSWLPRGLRFLLRSATWIVSNFSIQSITFWCSSR